MSNWSTILLSTLFNQKLGKGKVMLKKSEQGTYEFEISVSDFLSSFKKFWIIILALSLIIAIGTFVFCYLTYEPTYTATVKLLIYNSDMEGATIISDNYEYDKAKKLTSTYIDILMNTNDYLEKIVEEYKLEQTLGYDASDLRSRIEVTLDGNSGNFFKISVKDNHRATASLIAEAVVDEFKNDILADNPVPQHKVYSRMHGFKPCIYQRSPILKAADQMLHYGSCLILIFLNQTSSPWS